MNENTAEEAKRLAKEKAEQAKKIATEKLEQVKNISADEAKEMAKEKLNTFNAMPMVNKVSYGAFAAAVLLGLVFTFSGGDDKSGSSSSTTAATSSSNEYELFAYNGKCEEGELIEDKQQKSRLLQCKFSKKTSTILEQSLYANGQVKEEVTFDLLYHEKGDFAYSRASSKKNYNANGDVTATANYVNKVPLEGKSIGAALKTGETRKHTTGKLSDKKTYAIKQNDDGKWVSLLEHSLKKGSNGKSGSEDVYEIKKNDSGTWASLQKSHVKFGQTGKKTNEDSYAITQNKKGEWYSAVVKKFEDTNNKSAAVITDLVLKESMSGAIRSYKVSEKSIDWNVANKNGILEMYEVVQDIDGRWRTLPKMSKKISNFDGKTTHYEFEIKKNKQTGKYASLQKLYSHYQLVDGKKIMQKLTESKVVESESGYWSSLVVKEVRYKDKAPSRQELIYEILKDSSGNNKNYMVSNIAYDSANKAGWWRKYVNKQNDDGSWINILIEEVSYKENYTTKRYTDKIGSQQKREVHKKANGRWGIKPKA